MVEHVGAEGVVAHEGRADGGEARKGLLVGASRVYDGVLVHVEVVHGEGVLCL